MDTQHHSLMSTSEDYKYYYLSENFRGETGVRRIEINKVGRECKEIFSYSMFPNSGNFFIERSIVKWNGKEPEGEELDELEGEVIISGMMRAMTSASRYLSYFDSKKCRTKLEPEIVFERSRVCDKLGIPTLALDTSDIPDFIRYSIPWIFGSRIMVTKECIEYLRGMKGLHSKENNNPDSVWIVLGINNILHQIFKAYPEFL